MERFVFINAIALGILQPMIIRVNRYFFPARRLPII